MLQLKNIVKTYVTGELRQDALKGVSINFRENEFVSILGQSGSGKTTLLNIIGGLDRYTSGDLIINGVSTEKYKDADWDYYRNNSIGFVFQSYNLIPHQSVLSNVEMALTLAGVSRKERKQRAAEALEKVGLKDHMHKRPNQMSGGQMQRVAIARALVNNPDILLADEPTGALDSETSIQIMNLLKEIAKDKLVIMVTHNPELAEQYSTRIVRLKDGLITDDSNPFYWVDAPAEKQKKKKISMSFGTALALSFNNLRTKKGRTLLTAFAGSIGIIGIALILAVSTGMNNYITNIQKDTMSSYPITISSETIDLSSMMGDRNQIVENMQAKADENTTSIYADYTDIETDEMLTSNVVENNLTAFKKYLDNPDSEIWQYLGENGAVYTYSLSFNVYSHDPEDQLINSDADTDEIGSSASSEIGMTSFSDRQSMMASLMGSSSATGASNFSEMMAGVNGAAVSTVVTDEYDVVYGSWPENYDEVVLVLGQNNGIYAGTLYQLGLITGEQYQDAVEAIDNGEEAKALSFAYDEVCDHTFYLVPACDRYEENDDGTFSLVSDDSLNEEQLLENAIELKITGIVRPTEDTESASISTAVAYTSKLTDYLIEHTNESAVVTAQEATPEINVLTGMEFEAPDNATKAEDAKEYISSLGISDKASLYQMVLYYMQNGTDTKSGESDNDAGTKGIVGIDTISSSALDNAADGSDASGLAEELAALGIEDVSSLSTEELAALGIDVSSMSSEELAALGLQGSTTDMSALAGLSGGTDESSLAAALDSWLENSPDEDILLQFYDNYLAGDTYEDNLESFGKVSYDAPTSISLYVDSFEDKDGVADCIDNYNQTVESDAQITYTDYVALLTSSVTTIINGISYVLIAFVAISLVVSCIMIGIITHISVMERTKEIGILRALGASKHNISQVFNAETFIIGCCAGALGIGLSLLLLFPINSAIASLSGIEGITAVLSPQAGGILVAISIVITMLGGLFPAKKAAKKDPVIALRTE